VTDAYIREHPERLLATLGNGNVSVLTPVPEPAARTKPDHRSPEVARENMAAIRGLAGGSG